MIHPHTELRHVNDVIGYGVFATRLIPKGTITWVRDDLDQRLSPDEVKRLGPLYDEMLDKYAYRDESGLFVLCWDNSRFVNHSCEATCLSPGNDYEIAVRDIRPGEELTDDYGTLNLDEPFPCCCGSRRCRKLIHPDDMERLADEWDAIVREAFPLIARTTQPLWALLKDKSELEIALHRSETPPSLREQYAPVP